MPSQEAAVCMASSHQTQVYMTKGKHSLNTSFVLMFVAWSAVPVRTLAQNLLVSSCSSICTLLSTRCCTLFQCWIAKMVASVPCEVPQNGCQRALRGAAYVLVSSVVVAPVGWSPETLDVLGVDEAEPRLTVRAPELIDQDLSLDESTKTSWTGQVFGKKLVTGYYAIHYDNIVKNKKTCTLKHCKYYCELIINTTKDVVRLDDAKIEDMWVRKKIVRGVCKHIKRKSLRTLRTRSIQLRSC
jgi:hypothetical protein